MVSQVYTNNAYAIDGCATFFKRTKFSLVKKYEVRTSQADPCPAQAHQRLTMDVGALCTGRGEMSLPKLCSCSDGAVLCFGSHQWCHDDHLHSVFCHQVEFNKAALSLSDSIAPEQKKTALNRLLKAHCFDPSGAAPQ